MGARQAAQNDNGVTQTPELFLHGHAHPDEKKLKSIDAPI